jgi:hypothetical protein
MRSSHTWWDGRVLSVPLLWSWRLSEATAKKAGRFELIENGQGVHWPESMKTSALKACFYGMSAHRPQKSARLSRLQANGRSCSVPQAAEEVRWGAALNREALGCR